MGYEKVKLKEVVKTLESGSRPKGGVSIEGIPSLGGEHINNFGGFKFNNLKFIPEEYYNKLKKGIIEKDDILIVKDGATTGKIAFVDEYFPFKEAAINEHVFRVSINESKAFSKYIFYYLYSNKGQNEIMKDFRGATVGGISKNFAELTNVPLPSLETQKKIADVLDKAMALIDKRKEQIQKLDEFIQSVFLDMFGDPVKNPKGWEMEKLGKKCEVYRGGSPRPIKSYLGGTIPWIKIGDATKGDNIHLYNTKEHIVEEGIKKSRLVKKGSLIFANCGVSLGFARIIQFDGCIHDGWLSFENISQDINKIFLLKLLNHYTEYFRKTAPDGTQPNLNTKIMKNFEVILPPIELQNKFAQIVQKTEEQKELLQKSLVELENNFNSLMQRAFKGELFD